MPANNKDVCKKAKDALLKLGQTPDEIAGSLADQDVKGVPRDGDTCVLHQYLEEVEGLLDDPYTEISVDSDNIKVGGCTLRSTKNLAAMYATREDRVVPYDEAIALATPEDWEHVLPDHIWEFIERFDELKYPDLTVKMLSCPNCGEDFMPDDAVEGVFCSVECAREDDEDDEDDDDDDDGENWDQDDDTAVAVDDEDEEDEDDEEREESDGESGDGGPVG